MMRDFIRRDRGRCAVDRVIQADGALENLGDLPW
jgi:hypothetical protein